MSLIALQTIGFAGRSRLWRALLIVKELLLLLELCLSQLLAFDSRAFVAIESAPERLGRNGYPWAQIWITYSVIIARCNLPHRTAICRRCMLRLCGGDPLRNVAADRAITCADSVDITAPLAVSMSPSMIPFQ